MVRQSNYTLLIICEGKNTEPLFFDIIRSRIMQGRYPVEHMAIQIHPEPEEKGKNCREEIKDQVQKDYVPKRRMRSLLTTSHALPPEIPGIPPLKWVLAAQEQLREGTYDEVWVVFDKDGHPAVEQALIKASEDINGKSVNVAYTSIAFEYYLLLHFERFFFPFEKSECRIDRVVLNCASPNADPAHCSGKRCVGGYARSKGYWDNTKNQVSVFPIIEPFLEKGFWNAAWVRHESELREGDLPFHERNPYLTSDSIVKRLIGKSHHHYDFIGLDQPYIFEKKLHIVFASDLTIKVTNLDNISFVLPSNTITLTTLDTGLQSKIGGRILINAGEEVSLPFATSANDLSQTAFSITINHLHLGLKL